MKAVYVIILVLSAIHSCYANWYTYTQDRRYAYMNTSDGSNRTNTPTAFQDWGSRCIISSNNLIAVTDVYVSGVQPDEYYPHYRTEGYVFDMTVAFSQAVKLSVSGIFDTGEDPWGAPGGGGSFSIFSGDNDAPANELYSVIAPENYDGWGWTDTFSDQMTLQSGEYRIIGKVSAYADAVTMDFEASFEAIPEPSSSALILSATGILFLYRSRRVRKFNRYNGNTASHFSQTPPKLKESVEVWKETGKGFGQKF